MRGDVRQIGWMSEVRQRGGRQRPLALDFVFCCAMVVVLIAALRVMP